MKTANHQRISFSIKFAPKISATAYGKITFNSNAANSTGTGTTTSQHSVSLSWNPSASAVAHYNVYRSGTSVIRRSLHKDSVRAGNVLYRYDGAGGTVVLLRHHCRRFYRKGEQPFKPGARADSVIPPRYECRELAILKHKKRADAPLCSLELPSG